MLSFNVVGDSLLHLYLLARLFDHSDLFSGEIQKIKELIPAGKATRIGLYKELWSWLDGSLSSFRSWKSGEPNNLGSEHCVMLGSSGIMMTNLCNTKRATICYNGKLSFI
uniref:C-type lectin domain-containing protein n=1 Tax=Labrus bergylta TaxID=56723 RepID=A0A3Q3GQ95_9LABR